MATDKKISAPAVNSALEGLYGALAADNKDIDLMIDALKAAMRETGQKEALVDPARLFQNNREGRKMLQSYCKRRGVVISFLK